MVCVNVYQAAFGIALPSARRVSTGIKPPKTGTTTIDSSEKPTHEKKRREGRFVSAAEAAQAHQAARSHRVGW